MERKWYGMNWIRRDKRLAIHIRDDFYCQWCLKDLHNAEPGDCQLDHVVSHNNGGSNEHTNLVTACADCNKAKNDHSPEEWVYELGARTGRHPDFDLQYFVLETMSRIEYQTSKPINRKLAKALIEGREPTLEDSIAS